MKAIQSVAYALTGVNIFAKASASSYANMAGNAKKAKEETKQLAGVHDEINNISEYCWLQFTVCERDNPVASF